MSQLYEAGAAASHAATLSGVPPLWGAGGVGSIQPARSDGRSCRVLGQGPGSVNPTGTRSSVTSETGAGSSSSDSSDDIFGASRDIDNMELELNSSHGLELEVISPDPENVKAINNDNIDPDQHLFRTKSWSSNYISLDNFQRTLLKGQSSDKILTVIHINCRSIKHKIAEIQDIMDKTHPSIVAITETWLDDNLSESIQIPGYKFVGKGRKMGRGGGIALLIENNLTHLPVDVGDTATDFESFESLFIKIKLKTSSPVIGVIYRPPGQGLQDFQRDFDQLTSKLEKKMKEIILVGDFNIDLLKVNDHKDTNIFYNSLIAHHYLPAITKPTRITQTTKTLIENIFCTNWSKLQSASIIISDLSDHLPIIVQFSLEKYKIKELDYTDRRPITAEGLEKFHKTLEGTNWDRITQYSELGLVNEAYESFISTYKVAYTDAFPLKRLPHSKKYKAKKAWMTPGLLKSCKKKNLLYAKYLKNPNSENKTKFTAYRNKFKAIRLHAEKNYYATEFLNCHSDLKSTWRLIRSALQLDVNNEKINALMIDDVRIEDPGILANKFNEYFINLPKELASNVPPTITSFHEYLPPTNLLSMGIITTSPDELLRIGLNFKKTHAVGLDGIDPNVGLRHLHLIIQPLTEIINSSLTNGIVPDALKTAKVVPIFKKGNKENMINYRPISILPFFAKFLEKIMHDRLSSFILKSKIIHASQHGFQEGHSTFMALLDMEELVSKAIDKNEYSIGVFLDLAKAFDTVNHNVLLKKLNHYGVRGTQLNWFKSYLESRTQCVVCNGATSELGYVAFGVPQGSNLGPLLFLIYINDLASVSSTLHFILFADDTNLVYSNTSPEALMDTVNQELTKVNTWFKANKLTLNADKSNFIIFKSHRKIKPVNWSLTLNDLPILQVESTKFLGVLIDQHLTWKTHINYIALKLAKNIGILSRIAYLLPKDIKKSLYNTLIYPYLNYCNFIWASNYPTRLQKLVTLQKRAIRLIEGAAYTASSRPIFASLKLLKINQIKDFQIADLFYCFEHNLLPDSFINYFSKASILHMHDTRGASSYRPIKARTNIRIFSVKSVGPHIWNSLPSQIQAAQNRRQFKRLMKEYLLDPRNDIA